MKRPAFQFYPADWRKDVELQSCSMAAQGLWINVLCIAHECEPYGHLTINGRPMTSAQLGRQVGLSPKECDVLLAELFDAGAIRRTPEGGYFSQRMVKDETLRSVRALGGKSGAEHGIKGADGGFKGGRPSNGKGGFKGGLETPLSEDLKPPPSSSSSSSPSGNTSITPKGACLRFDEFWKAWPVTDRKQARGKCFDAWKKAHGERDAAVIVAHVEHLKLSVGWTKNGGEFIPAPLAYLNKRSWEGVEETPVFQERYV